MLSTLRPGQLGLRYSAETEGEGAKKTDALTMVLYRSLAGSVVIEVNRTQGDLDLLFVLLQVHNKGIGYTARCEAEKLHPEVTVWEMALASKKYGFD